MGTRAVSLRVPDEVYAEIYDTMRRSGRDFSSIANEMLAEAVKMRRIPGIVFADGPTGRRARVGGTGIEVFEVIRAYRKMDQSWDRLRAAFHWLNEHQLRAALAYAEAYPEEIDERLAAEDRWTPEAIWEQYPFLKPRGSHALLP